MLKHTCLFILFVLYCDVAQAQNQNQVISLGIVAPLSGDFANYGEHIQRGAELAKEDLKKENIDIKLKYEDACLPLDAVKAIQKLIEIDSINGVAASYCVVGTVPMIPVLERMNLIGFHTSVLPNRVLESKKIFTTNGRIDDEASLAADYAYDNLKARRAAILFLITQWGETYADSFKEKFKSKGGMVVRVESNPIGINDFRSELTRIKQHKPDLIFMVHVGPTLGIALKQARQLGLKQQILTVNESEDISVIEQAREAAEGLTFFAPEPKQETAAMKSFREAFVERYAKLPHPLSKHAYDEVKIVSETNAKCNLSNQCVLDEVAKIKDYDGASGKFSFEADGGVAREFVLKKVKNGQFVVE